MPSVHEPAFIVNSQLGVDGSFSPTSGPNEPVSMEAALSLATGAKYLPNGYLTSSPDSDRSTSAGSSSPLATTKENEIESHGLPDYDYPVPFVVRNTFIDTDLVRPISLDDFYESRRVCSCPVESPPGLCSDPGFATMHYPVPMPQMPPLPMMDSMLAAAIHASAAAAAAASCWIPNIGMQPPMQPPLQGFQSPAYPCPPVSGMEPPVLRLADALEVEELALGSPECPTIGSTGHRLGNCKPCAFFHTKGCGNGTQCPFCHLCGAGEKKTSTERTGDGASRDAALWVHS